MYSEYMYSKKKTKPLKVVNCEDGSFRIFVGPHPITKSAANPRQAAIELRYLAEQLETQACISFHRKLS